MVPKLKELIDNGVVSEVEVIDFISTLKKLSTNDFMDKRNFKMVLDHFGFKKKKRWIKIEPGVKVKL